MRKPPTKEQMEKRAEIIRNNTGKTCKEVCDIVFKETGDLVSTNSIYNQGAKMNVRLKSPNIDKEDQHPRNPLANKLINRLWDSSLRVSP